MSRDKTKGNNRKIMDNSIYPIFIEDKSKQNVESLEYYVKSIHQSVTTSLSGKSAILRVFDKNNQKEIEYHHHRDFERLYSHINCIITMEDGGEYLKPYTKVWLGSQRKRAALNGTEFDPKKDPLSINNEVFNIYQGFGIKPEHSQERDISPWLELVTVICNNDKTKIDYLINWFAHAIQKPEEKPGVAIVMRSGQGYGKGSLMKPFASIFGAHYMHSTNSKDISSNFNAVLENKLMVFFDEAFAGTNQATDILKGLITESKLRIERKGFDTYFIDNYIRIVMASNRENIIRFEKDERRYLYIDVPEDNKLTLEKFDEYYSWERNGGAGNLFGYLNGLNIENFNPRVAPKTNELDTAKMYSFSGSEQIIFHILNDESTFDEVFIQNKNWSMIYKQSLNLAQIYGVKKELINDIALGRLLKKIGFKKKRKRTSEGSTYEVITPFKENIMSSIRSKFEEVMGFDIEWCPLSDHLELAQNDLEKILMI